MKFTKTKIEGVIIIEPKVFSDERGYFFESFNQKEFEENIGKINFIQDNESKSQKGVLRGLHFQKPPFEQAKLVRCIKGKILDVSVDIRKKSKTFGQYILSEDAIFAYKVDNIYKPDYESGIIWNDKNLNIDWQLNENEVILSERDKDLFTFKELKIN